ncbi:MAG: translation initiation factor IF-2 subunit gamma [Candidatus Thermoplasmatota archaeon]|nr:translation initiation factor IF-2 subunit gamma [Candidatus Thermoplasmatota archaeon]
MKVPKQPEVNIGLVGHVDHGKTTLAKALTGEWTDRHSEELKRGISIRLGYADAAFYKCPECPEPECYSTNETCAYCKSKSEMLRCVSFVDSPGHETLMATMLSGAAIMDGALLLIAANEHCPQPQTKEHLMALDIVGIKNIVIAQNKIDLVDENKALENYEQIKKFVKGTCAENAPIIPVSAQHSANIDMLIKALQEKIPTIKKAEDKPIRMCIARSFDVNMPGNRPKDLVGGIIGGTLLQGVLKVGDKIEIKPGRKVEQKGKVFWEPIITEVTTLVSGGRRMSQVTAGGLIGVGTNLDPAITKADGLAGKVAGMPGTLPETLEKVTLEITLLERVAGTAEELKVEDIKTHETLMLTVGVTTTVGIVTSARGNECDVFLKLPICAERNQRVAVSRRVAGRWRLIGYGAIK